MAAYQLFARACLQVWSWEQGPGLSPSLSIGRKQGGAAAIK